MLSSGRHQTAAHVTRRSKVAAGCGVCRCVQCRQALGKQRTACVRGNGSPPSRRRHQGAFHRLDVKYAPLLHAMCHAGHTAHIARSNNGGRKACVGARRARQACSAACRRWYLWCGTARQVLRHKSRTDAAAQPVTNVTANREDLIECHNK